MGANTRDDGRPDGARSNEGMPEDGMPEDGMPYDGDATEGGTDQPRRRRSRELTPTQRALGLLTRREHSRKELVRKLVAKGVASEDVEVVVAKLADAGWQNDARFAESRVRVRVGDGYGPRYIRAELATHGLDQVMIDVALDTFDGSWTHNARDLARRRYGNGIADDLVLGRKAADLLARRGFDVACIRAATRIDTDD